MMGQRGRSDEDIVLFFKVFPCNKEYNHDFAACFNTHKGDKARRRCLLQHSYSAKMCPDMKNTGKCPRGDSCNMTHSLFEYWLHPMRYRTKMCKDAANCSRPYCFFAHQESELREPTPEPQPLASLANMVGSTCGAQSSSTAAAAAVAVTAPPTPNKHSGPVLFRQLSGQQRDMLLSIDPNTSSLFGLHDSCTASAAAPCAYTPVPMGAANSSSSSSTSEMLPVLDMPACTAGLFPVAATGSSPLASYFAGEPSPLALDVISSCIARPMPAVMAATSPSTAGVLLQQQQQSLANIDPATLAALLQRINVGGVSGEGVAGAQPPPPPPRIISPRSSLGSNIGSNSGQLQLISAGTPHQAYIMAQQPQVPPPQLVQLVSAPVSNPAVLQSAQGLLVGRVSPNQHRLQQQQQQLGCDFAAMSRPFPSPGPGATAGASELSFSDMLPAATVGMEVQGRTTAALGLDIGSFSQQLQQQW